MSETRRTCFVALALALYSVSGPAWATAGDGSEPVEPGAVEIAPPKDALIPEQGRNQFLVGTLLSASVVGASGDRIGKVKDLILDVTGRTVGVVIGVGGVMGIGDKAVAIPLSRVVLASAVSADDVVIRTDLSRAEIDIAPEFHPSDAKAPPLGRPAAPGSGVR